MFVFITFLVIGQTETNVQYDQESEKETKKEGNLMIGGYAEVHYNQPLQADERSNGDLDVHRMVLLMGYSFNARTKFVTEIEFEHVSEVYVEQAYLQYKLNSFMNLKGGLLLIPMGVVNEDHEPTSFHGVERPFIDKYISPSTWREIGIGLSGNIIAASLKYQAYLVDGFNGYNGSALLNGKNGLRKGRQKGGESYISSPAFTSKVEYYGLGDFRIGASAYFGNSQSTLYDGLDRNDTEAMMRADSSVVGISMYGFDLSYQLKGLNLKGQCYLINLSNTTAYNQFSGANDLGSAMNGYFVEASYDVFKNVKSISSALHPFVRYEAYDTHYKVEDSIERNPGLKKQVITTGLSWYPAKGAVVKAELQFLKSGSADAFSTVFNAGFGVMF